MGYFSFQREEFRSDPLVNLEKDKFMPGPGTVLLVEDNEDDALLMECAFNQAHFINPIYVVRDGKEAINYLKGEGRYSDRLAFPLPYLVLLDWRLPQVDGLAVLRWIRQQPSLSPLPVVVLAGMLNEEQRKQAAESGANFCLTKPPGFRSLVEEIQRYLASWLGVGQIATPA